jgi:CMP-N,N'-diacetyllegionaminic acid synthase
MKNIAIITARSGSKGLPNKNILPLDGKPLIAHTIIAAKESGMFDTVMVSTDSEEYAAIAREWGAEVPFLRSEENSSDKAGSWPVVREVLEEYRKLGQEFDTLTLLQPTSPLRNAEDIKNAYKLMEEKGAHSVVSMSEALVSPLSCLIIPSDLCMGGLVNRANNTRRQDRPTYHYVNGAIYVVRVDTFPDDNFIYDDTCYVYIMPEERSIDIDTALDFMLVETVIKYNKENQK